jgi:hypothetical protein
MDREAKYKAWVEQCMKTDGWYAHYVAGGHACAQCGDDEHPSDWPEHLMNAHTHGFETTWKHPDFQVVLGMNQRTVHDLFWELADRVKDGTRYAPGVHTGLVKWGDPLRQAREPMRMKWANEEGRRVLRVLMPDPEGKLPDEAGCEELYRQQDGFDTAHKGESEDA